MQEKSLARRTLHFPRGQMVWACSEAAFGQEGYANYDPIWALNARAPLHTFKRAFERAYDCPLLCEYENKDEDEVVNDNHRPASIVDLRVPSDRNESAPELLTSKADPLCSFLSRAFGTTIYYVWYDIVAEYSDRRLTFAFDKLPALAGIASRIHDVTRDDYLAGHWRRELERSLFWRLETETACGHPGRVKEYRAPSWSWASVDAFTLFDYANLNPDEDLPTTIEILEASVDVEGKNPFGCVTAGKLVIKADIIRASWHEGSGSWRIDGAVTTHGDTQFDDLKFTSPDEAVIGIWKYDDVVHGILPGPPIEETTPLEEVYRRSVPRGYFGSVASSNIHVHGPDSNDSSTLCRRGTYIPEDLLLVKGPTRKLEESEQEWQGGRNTSVDVLVLAASEEQAGTYRRIGWGKLGMWYEAIESSEVLTVV